jgi:hypothetical protein
MGFCRKVGKANIFASQKILPKAKKQRLFFSICVALKGQNNFQIIKIVENDFSSLPLPAGRFSANKT